MKLNKFHLTRNFVENKHMGFWKTMWVLPYHNLVGQYIIRISLFEYIGGLFYLLLEFFKFFINFIQDLLSV